MKYKPTDAELEILQVIWVNGPSTVRFVNQELCKKRPVVYTTTLKFMQLMTEKELLTRSTANVSHVYDCKAQQSQVQRDLVANFIDKVFRGSTASLMMQAMGNSKPSREELEQMKKIINDLDKNAKGKKK